VETRANPTQAWRFGVFEVDARAIELRRGGTPVKLREQSFSILVFLLEHAGELVTREDLRRVLWAFRHLRRLRPQPEHGGYETT
jgi:DNA-binding winged helix-turn-helix (wHTH) protein